MKTRKRIVKKHKKGLVLPVVAAIALCLALLGLGVLRLGLGSRLMSTRTMSGVTARAAADAGITRALYEMNNNFTIGPGWNGTLASGNLVLGNSTATCSYTTQYFPLAHPVTGEDYWLITSIGELGTQQSTVYATLGIRNRFDWAVIVTEKITLNNDTLVDGYISYDEITGVKYDYGSTLPDGSLNAFKDVRMGTTYSGQDPMIWLYNNAFTYGQVLVGVGGNPGEIIRPLGNPGPTVTGGYGIMSEQWLFDDELLFIKVPETVPNSGNINQASFVEPSITLGTSGTTTYYRYTDIDVPGGRSLIFLGDVKIHITGDLILNNTAALNVGDLLDPTVVSSVEIFLDGNLDVRNGATINNWSEIPAMFRLLGTGLGEPQLWEIKNSGNYYGIYYGPNAVIDIKATAQFFGSVSGYNFDLFNGGRLHYDHALSGMSEYDTGFGIDRLWEKSDFVLAAGP